MQMWQAVVSDVPLLYTLSGFSSVVFIHMRNTTNNSSIQREKKLGMTNIIWEEIICKTFMLPYGGRKQEFPNISDIRLGKTLQM